MTYALNEFCCDLYTLFKAKGQAGLPEVAEKPKGLRAHGTAKSPCRAI
jgi:hypothetical protein